LRCLENQIENGESLDFAHLPDGIIQYYAQYCLKYRNQSIEDWHNKLLPVLATLAAAREAVSLPLLQKWSGVEVPVLDLKRILEEEWKPFVICEKKLEEGWYRLYHATLHEFLAGQISPGSISDSEAIVIEETSSAVRLSHGRIADFFINAWGGWGTTLDSLKNSPLDDQQHSYGLHYMLTHLINSDRRDQVHKLLQLTRTEYFDVSVRTKRGLSQWFSRKEQVQTYVQYENVWYAAHRELREIPGYLNDIDVAWNLAQEKDHPKDLQQSITRQIQYALIRTSLNSHLNNVIPELLPWLLKQHLWSYEQTILYLKTIQDPSKRAHALITILDKLERDDTPLLLNVSRDLADMLHQPGRAKSALLLGKILKELINKGYSTEAFELIGKQHTYARIELYHALSSFSRHAQELGLQEIEALENSLDRIQGLIFFLPSLDPPERTAISNKIRDLLSSLQFDLSLEPSIWKAPLLDTKRLAAFSPALNHVDAFKIYEIFARAFPATEHKTQILANIVPYLPHKNRKRIIEKVLRESTRELSYAAFHLAGKWGYYEYDDLTNNVVHLLSELDGPKKHELAEMILEYAEGPTSWKWWLGLLKKMMAGNFNGQEDLLPLAPLGLDLIGRWTSSRNGEASNSGLCFRFYWLVSLLRYYELSPRRMTKYVRKVRKLFERMSNPDRIFAIAKIIPLVQAEERDGLFEEMVHILSQLRPSEQQEELEHIIPWINDENKALQKQEVMEKLLSITESINDWKDNIWLQSGLMEYASESLRKTALPTILRYIPSLGDRLIIWALVSIVPYLDSESFAKAVRIAGNEKAKHDIWIDKLYRPGNSFAEIMAVTQDDQRRIFIYNYARRNFFNWQKMYFFLEAAQFLPRALMEQALTEANTAADSLEKALILGVLVPHIALDKQKEIISEVRKLISNAESDNSSRQKSANKDQESSSYDTYALEDRQNDINRFRVRISECWEKAGLLDDAIHILFDGELSETSIYSFRNPKMKSLGAIIQKTPSVKLDYLARHFDKYLITSPTLFMAFFTRFMALQDFTAAYDLLWYHTIRRAKFIPRLSLSHFGRRFEELTDREQEKELWLQGLNYLLEKPTFQLQSREDSIDEFVRGLPSELLIDVIKEVDKKGSPYLQILFLTKIVGKMLDPVYRTAIVKRVIQLIGDRYSEDTFFENSRDTALAALSKSLAETSFIEEALAVVEKIKTQSSRDQALLGLLISLDKADDITENTLKSLVDAILGMDGNIFQMRGFEFLGKFLARGSGQRLYRNWQIVWSSMRTVRRPELLWHLRGLLPAIHKLGGQPVIDEIYNVVGSVCKSWT
jgi:hypothetical protein